MLRLAVLLLVLANSAYFAWSQGLLAPLGLAPAVQTEPQRLGAQIRPEAMRLLTADEARRLENGAAAPTNGNLAGATASAPAECLQAGLFNEQQTATLRASLESALPAGSWQLESSVEPARWIVYMGKYTSEDALAKKRTELRQLGVPFRAVNNEALAPGLALASFASQAEAEKELARVATRGVRTARVAQERAEARGQILKLPAADAGLRKQLDSLTAQLEGKALRPCG
ncbi:MAG: SPOR domain-containing protein [Polaromonas sp.]|nr:SPOR domain-containing protein [Polaromonas sp.]